MTEKSIINQVISWLTEEEILQEKREEENGDIHLLVNYPRLIKNSIIEIHFPENKKDFILIGALTTVSSVHYNKLIKLTETQKKEFNYNFSELLNDPFTEYIIEFDNDNNIKYFVIESSLFTDSLSKNIIMFLIKNVFKMKNRAIQYIKYKFD